ncbi:MAG: hypothetical protein H7281_01905 [Bacteriovorax sp.]|nr:hypothetical protein [Bacteriovorax sp.]
MKFLKMPAFIFLTVALLSAGCVTDPGVLKKRGLVNDFSITKTTIGCGTSFLILSQPGVCTTSCASTTTTAPSGVHLASATELTTAKTAADAALLAKINGSAGLCVEDVVKTARPTNQIDIKSDFCSCINGKSDLISDCAATCASQPTSTSPTLYLNTIIGTDIALNTNLGNLYNWCHVPLNGETGQPQCFLSATDGATTISNIPVTIGVGSNSLTANILSLALDKTYIVKIIESGTGSNAVSKEFQLRRKTQVVEDTTQLGALKVTPINQYTCMTYGGTVNTAGQILRTSYARVFYYFASNETPPPIPPAGGSNQSQVVCHDEQLHPGNDSAEYPRLEMIPQALAMWDKADPRFVNLENTGLIINKTLTTRLYNEYHVTVNLIDIFKLINYPNRPTTTSTSTANIPLGYMMVPFTDPKTGKTFCPTQTDFNSTDPLFSLLKEYMDDTEGLFLAEKEAETIQDVSNFKTIYGTMFVTESTVKTYGFYIQNGLKIKADQSSMNTKTIYYYWPTSTTMDPMVAGNRKLFTVRSPNTLNGNIPTGQSTTAVTTDKRIGCVPKSSI